MDFGSRRVVFVAVLVLAIGVGVVGAAHITGTVKTSGDVPLSSEDNTTVVLDGSADALLDDFEILTGTVDLKTESGNMTVFSSGDTEVWVQPSDIEGTWTNVTQISATQNTVHLDPDDKTEFDVGGDADTLSFREPTADDGTVDFVISASGGSSTVLVGGLAGSSTFTAVNESTGAALDVADSDTNGFVEFKIYHSTQKVLIQSGDQSASPSQSNASPTGKLTQKPSDLSVDVEDGDFPDDNVTVEFHLDGSKIDTQHIQSNQTVTTSIPSSGQTAGSHNWEAKVVDRVGNADNKTYSYEVPSNITLREESRPHDKIDTASVEAIFFEDTADTPTIINKTTTTGEIDLTGLPTGSEFAVSVSAPGYHNRTVLLDNIYTQNTTFLINRSVSDEVLENQFVLNDRTGNFPNDETELIVELAINQSLYRSSGGFDWRAVAGDDLGADRAFVTDLRAETRYRLRVQNTDGDQRILGAYTPEFNGTVDLEVGELSISVPEDDSYGVDASWDSGNEDVVFEYSDPQDNTSYIDLKIYERNNESNTIHDQNHTSGPYGTLKVTESVGNDNETAWVVDYELGRPDVQTGSFVVGPQRAINPGLSDFWQSVGGSAALVVVAGLFGGLRARAGVVALPLLAGALWFIGWLPGAVGAGAIIFALGVGVIYATTGREGVPGA